MTSVEVVDSKRPRLGSYEHPVGAALPPPHASHSAAYHPAQHPHHSHHHPPPPPPPPPPHHHHHHHSLPPPAPHAQPSPHPPPPYPPHQQASQAPPPHPPHPHHQPPQHTQPPPSSAGENRSRPYSSHASTLPMPTHHGADSSEPSQYHHGQQYHARQYSSEPMSARTPTTPSQQGPPQDIKHGPQYYHEPYRQAHETNHQSPYHGHDPAMHPPITLAPGHESQRNLPYPTMPHQASEGPTYEPWPYSSVIAVPTDAGSKRKAVRASQACESCRQKKCKCDEDKPICGNCKQNGTQCHYRDVPPPKQERTMLQVMEQISGLASQINEVSHRLNQFGASAVRKDELRGELDSAIRSTLHRELRELRDDMRGLQPAIKRNSEYSQSPVSRSHFASPNPLYNGDHSVTRLDGRRQLEAHQNPRDPPTGYSPAGSQPSEASGGRARSTPQQHVSRKLSIALDPALRSFDPLAGQLSIPLEHSTAAHKLLIAWDAIHPFYAGILKPSDAQNYVMREETTRGNLRIFGQGEGSDGMARDENPQIMKQGSFSDVDVSSASNASSTDGNWGIGFDGPIIPANDIKGGLNLDGTLCLDATTLTRLYQSFLSNMWILHPFLNKERLHRTFERFLHRYGQDAPSYVASYISSPPGSAKHQTDMFNPFKAPKRKRSDPGLDDKGTPIGGKAYSEASRLPLERSISNALMLLIFALGHMCEHKEPLPPPVTDAPQVPAPVPPKSPSYNTPLSTATPGFASEFATPDASGRSPFSDSSSRFTTRLRNIDKIPGLAYFAYAVNILGEHHGSPDLVHVQCSLLAGIYFGQMARVIDSWRWINTACTDCQLLFKDETSFEDMDPERADSIQFAYWTGLQLESDILAELDLPHSGISRLEDRMDLPNWSTLHYPDGSHENIVIQYYWAQIHIRKILNRAHSALYNSGKEPLKNPGWTIYSADDLALQLAEWRAALPERLRWVDEDEPATEVNDARLRGKYYGARYVIHRPFLHHLLQSEANKATAPHSAHLKTKEKEGVFGMARKCIEAARRSTIAFDGLEGRPLITNIFGTAHAQFGNVLVLAACAKTQFRWIVGARELDHLLQRTINFIAPIARLAPAMKTNLQILEHTAAITRSNFPDEDAEMQTAGASSSFCSSTH